MGGRRGRTDFLAAWAVAVEAGRGAGAWSPTPARQPQASVGFLCPTSRLQLCPAVPQFRRAPASRLPCAPLCPSVSPSLPRDLPSLCPCFSRSAFHALSPLSLCSSVSSCLLLSAPPICLSSFPQPRSCFLGLSGRWRSQVGGVGWGWEGSLSQGRGRTWVYYGLSGAIVIRVPAEGAAEHLGMCLCGQGVTPLPTPQQAPCPDIGLQPLQFCRLPLLLDCGETMPGLWPLHALPQSSLPTVPLPHTTPSPGSEAGRRGF